MHDPLIASLKSHFGLTAFRPHQREIISALLDGHSCLAILPTGGGKSLTYQLPALLLPGLSLVISPLISLIRDQTQALTDRGYPVAWIDSTQTPAERSRQLDILKNGDCKLFYLSPESLSNNALLHLLKSQKISLAAIDEAHCISEWGHSFRPAYLYLPKLLRQLKPSVTLALTATATAKTASHIRKLFRIKTDHQFGGHSPRPNLHYRIIRCSEEQKPAQLIEALSSPSQLPAVVYAMRQEQCEQISHHLSSHGLKARSYHAGMSSHARTSVQDDFLHDNIQVVVATIAFGMGVDKPNIRSVIHYHLPKSPEGWLQESGRAGRDAHTSHCTLLACADDLIPLRNFTEAKRLRPTTIQSLIQHLFGQGKIATFSPYQQRVKRDIHTSTFDILLAHLQVRGLIRFHGTSWSHARAWPTTGKQINLSGYPTKIRKAISHILSLGERCDTHTYAETFQVAHALIWETLEDLYRLGEIVLHRSGWFWHYRILKPQTDLHELATSLIDTLSNQADQEFAKIDAVHRIAKSKICISKQLARWFGNHHTDDCGHCSSCLGMASSSPLPARHHSELEHSTLEILHQLSRDPKRRFQTNQQFARFLSGIPSPYLRHRWLTQHPHFGILSYYPYSDCLAYAKAFLNAAD